MPIPYISKISKKHNIPIKELEKLWDDAKEKEGHKNWPIIMTVFKNMVNSKYSLNDEKIFLNI